MSEDQLTALLAKLKGDAELQEKLKGAADLDTAVAIAKEAGFDVEEADWLKYQAKQTLELSDEELESAAGGKQTNPSCNCTDVRTSPCNNVLNCSTNHCSIDQPKGPCN